MRCVRRRIMRKPLGVAAGIKVSRGPIFRITVECKPPGDEAHIDRNFLRVEQIVTGRL